MKRQLIGIGSSCQGLLAIISLILLWRSSPASRSILFEVLFSTLSLIGAAMGLNITLRREPRRAQVVSAAVINALLIALFWGSLTVFRRSEQFMVPTCIYLPVVGPPAFNAFLLVLSCIQEPD